MEDLADGAGERAGDTRSAVPVLSPVTCIQTAVLLSLEDERYRL